MNDLGSLYIQPIEWRTLKELEFTPSPAGIIPPENPAYLRIIREKDEKANNNSFFVVQEINPPDSRKRNRWFIIGVPKGEEPYFEQAIEARKFERIGDLGAIVRADSGLFEEERKKRLQPGIHF